MHRKATIKTTRTTFPSCDEVCLQQQQQKIKTLLQYVAIRCVRIRHPQGHVASRTSLKTLNSNSVTVSAGKNSMHCFRKSFSHLSQRSWRTPEVGIMSTFSCWRGCIGLYGLVARSAKLRSTPICKRRWKWWKGHSRLIGFETTQSNFVESGNAYLKMLGLERTANMWQSTCVHIFQPWFHVWLDSV